MSGAASLRRSSHLGVSEPSDRVRSRAEQSRRIVDRLFGYPISEARQEGGFLVQYFERNRFEYHPEFAGTPNDVLLGLLGVETTRRYGWIAP